MNEETLRRREFLARTAAAAGMAGAATLLPPDALLAEAASAARAGAPLPEPARLPDRPRRRADDGEPVVRPLLRLDVGHRRRDAAPDLPRPAGNAASTRPPLQLGLGDASHQGCGYPDPGHGWDSGRVQMRRRASSPTAPATTSSRSPTSTRASSASSTTPRKAYTLYDRFHCSLMCSTWPNRYYMWSAQSGGIKNNTPPVADARQPVGHDLRPCATARA